MVPNPFRLLMRAIPGGGDSQSEESRERPVEEPSSWSGAEPDDAADGETAVSAEHSTDAEDREAGDEPDFAEPESREESHESHAGEDDGPEEIDASNIPAPSIGPHTTITLEDSETRLARHEQSGVDAMGLEKRREVVGGSYGASFAKQATLYGLFLLVVGLLVFGAVLAVNEFDQPPDEQKLEAPWKDSTDPAKPSELDFPVDSAPKQVPTGPDSTSSGGSDST